MRLWDRTKRSAPTEVQAGRTQTGEVDGGGMGGPRLVQRGGGFPSMISLTKYSVFAIGDEGVETNSGEGYPTCRCGLSP